jgi:hypothetical protein
MRKTFKREELKALTVGRPCEWRNGRWWKEGKVIGEPQTDSLGCQYIPVHNYSARTSTVNPGELIRAYPTFIRVRV